MFFVQVIASRSTRIALIIHVPAQTTCYRQLDSPHVNSSLSSQKAFSFSSYEKGPTRAHKTAILPCKDYIIAKFLCVIHTSHKSKTMQYYHFTTRQPGSSFSIILTRINMPKHWTILLNYVTIATFLLSRQGSTRVVPLSCLYCLFSLALAPLFLCCICCHSCFVLFLAVIVIGTEQATIAAPSHSINMTDHSVIQVYKHGHSFFVPKILGHYQL